MIKPISIFCPHCHQYTLITPAPVNFKNRSGSNFSLQAAWQASPDICWWIGICNCCQNPVLVQNSASIIFPHPQPQPTNENVPEAIRADLDEAKRCFAVLAWRGAAVLARRSMQAATIERGANPKKSLLEQIDELQDQGKITLDLKEWATVVRWIGNDAAHPGGHPIEKDEAEEVLKLAEQFLHVLYVTPATAKLLRAKIGK